MAGSDRQINRMVEPEAFSAGSSDTCVTGPRFGKWVYVFLALPPMVGLLTALLAPETHGHWSEHLSSVGLKSTQLVLLLVAVTSLRWRTLSVPLLMAFAALSAGISLQVIGDYTVAESIWRMPGNPGFGSGYAEGHDMAASGDLLVLIGGLAFAVTARIGRRISTRLVVLAVVMAIIPPPYFWPGAGVLVLLVHGLTSGAGFRRVNPERRSDQPS